MPSRRSFVKAAALGAGAGTVLAACGQRPAADAPAVHANPRIVWRLASSFPRSTDIIYGPAEQLAKRVSALTGGRFTIRVFPGGELVPPFEVMGAVQRGIAHMAHTASYYFKGVNPAFCFDCTLPFGLTARQHTAWVLHGGGMELLRELFASVDIVNLLGGNTGTQMGGWFRQPINSLADLRGLRMRIPGFGGEVMARLGVSVQAIPGGEVYPALERGVIDATEWVGPHDDEKLGFYRVAKNYYAPGWWEPGPAISFYVGRAAWEGLPQQYRDVLELAAAEASTEMISQYDAKNPEAIARLVEQGVVLRRFPADMMEAARRESEDVLESTASANPSFRRIFEPWKQFREKSYRWFSVAEESFSNFSFPNRLEG